MCQSQNVADDPSQSPQSAIVLRRLCRLVQNITAGSSASGRLTTPAAMVNLAYDHDYDLALASIVTEATASQLTDNAGPRPG